MRILKGCRIARFVLGLLLAFSVLAPAPGAQAKAKRFIVVASTTSTENSGLFDFILPKFERATGIQVRVIAKGTGLAIDIARRGDADVLFVHHRPSEEAFVAQGYGVKRFDVMYNDFIIVGPAADPAGIRGMTAAAKAFRTIAKRRVLFVSRGDESGTHRREREIWQAAGIDPSGDSGTWYRAAGAGMGATLNIAAEMDAYTLSDRATWVSFRNKRGLELLVAGDPMLFNQYGVILVNPKRFPHVRAADGQRFIDWLLSPDGQATIAAYRVNGQQLFHPDAKPQPSPEDRSPPASGRP